MWRSKARRLGALHSAAGRKASPSPAGFVRLPSNHPLFSHVSPFTGACRRDRLRALARRSYVFHLTDRTGLTRPGAAPVDGFMPSCCMPAKQSMEPVGGRPTGTVAEPAVASTPVVPVRITAMTAPAHRRTIPHHGTLVLAEPGPPLARLHLVSASSSARYLADPAGLRAVTAGPRRVKIARRPARPRGRCSGPPPARRRGAARPRPRTC